jgi:hypothetical protein
LWNRLVESDKAFYKARMELFKLRKELLEKARNPVQLIRDGLERPTERTAAIELAKLLPKEQLKELLPSLLSHSIESDSSDVLFKLRTGNGLDLPTFQRLVATIDRLAALYADEHQLPKSAAGIFFDIYPAMMSASYQYSQGQQQEVMEAADELADHIRSCLNTSQHKT